MNWKFKAFIQKLISGLPGEAANTFYYYVQRNFGSFKRSDPQNQLLRASEIVEAVIRQKQTLADKIFMEIGTGRTLDIPIGLWLCGASKIITFDLNPYLKEELVFESLDWIRSNKDEMKNIFSSPSYSDYFDRRLDSLITFDSNFDDLKKMIGVDYSAPADGSRTDIKSNSIDVHFSTNVFEHIPEEKIRGILREAKRLLAVGGILIHFIDLSDHFSSIDPSVNPVNFLRFSEKEWESYAGNRFMYHNRLRACEFERLFKEEGFDVIQARRYPDSKALEALRGGMPLDKRFAAYPLEELATTRLDVVGRSR